MCDGQALWVRLSGERRALEQARVAMGALDQVPEAGFWEAVREQRLPFFRDHRPLWRISLPPATRALALLGDWLIDWAGAQRWLKTDAGAEEVRRSAAEERGYPARSPPAVWPVPRHARRAFLFEGCVQRRSGQELDRLVIGVFSAYGCCGALSHHLAAGAQTHEHMRRNLDAWWHGSGPGPRR